MKKTFVFAALCAAAIAVSCNKNVIDETVVNNDGETMTFTCVIAPDTKLGIDNAGKTTWEVGDEILVHGEYTGEGKSLTVALTANDISADGKTATINVTGVTPYERLNKFKSTIYAAYPASAVKDNDHCYYYSNFTDTNVPMMAAYNVDNTFVFYNLCGVIALTVNGDFDSVTFSGNNDETVGYSYYRSYVAQKTDDTPRLDYNYTTDGGTSGPLTSVSAPVVADGNTVNYIFLPNGTNFGGGFTFKFKKNDELAKVAKTNTAVNVGRSELLVLGDITSRLENYVPPTTSDHKSAITGATDITSGITANCYIVNSPGAYKFPAVKGNSATEAGNVFGAQILWETCNNGDDLSVNDVIAAVDFEDNWIYFKTPDVLKPGNALIAAKNSEGEIIWSWHIWVPATPVGVGGESLMDRNLGALSAPAVGPVDITTLGLAYQWGRKDPFPGPSTFDEAEPAGAKVAGTAISVVHDDAAPQGSVPLSILNPTVLYTTNNSDWSSSENSSLWNDGDAKTMYDPCPGGYRVPVAAKSPIVFAGDLSGSTGWAKDEANKLFTVGSEPALVFPLGGYIDDYSGSFKFCHVGDRVAIWAAEGSGVKGTVIDVRFDKGTQKTTTTSKSRVAYVRCVVE